MEQLLQKSFLYLDYIIDIHKGHFQVDLGEFRLPIGPQVFIPEAFDDLHVPIGPPHHQQLLEHLGRLGKSIKFPRVDSAGYQIIPGTFRCGIDQHGRFNLCESLGIIIFPGNLGYLVTKLQIILHFILSKIQVTIFQTKVFIHLVIILDINGRSIRLRIDDQIRCKHFDISGGQIWILGLTFLDHTLDANHVFAS